MQVGGGMKGLLVRARKPRSGRTSCEGRLRQPEPRMRLAVRGVPEGALRTHSA